MNPSSDNYAFILRSAAEAYLAEGLEAGRLILSPIEEELWPGMPAGSVKQRRQPANAQRFAGRRVVRDSRAPATFQRDHFRCSYCCIEGYSETNRRPDAWVVSAGTAIPRALQSGIYASLVLGSRG